MEWHSLKKEAVIKHLKSSSDGLTEQEAKKRLVEFGKNEVKEIYKISPIKIFIKQFKSFLVYILLAAIAISIFIQHYVDAGVIFAIVLLNAGIGFVQQFKVEKSILKLRQLFVPKAKVFRDGKLKTISSKDIVPGDLILFDEGDKILADCRILSSENLEVNEAILTGESNPVEKYETWIRRDGILAERINMLHTGTTVVRGDVHAIVVSTGMETEFGKIALNLQQIPIAETPMQKKLDKFAKQVSIVVLILAALIFFIGIANGRDKVEMFLTAIALLISAIPEGLPAIITISLAFATNSMLKHNVLIRRLPAAETLGSVTVICSDKTGTITEEKMEVSEIFCDDKNYTHQNGKISLGKKNILVNNEKGIYDLVKTSVLASNARFEEREDKKGYQVIGDATESAFVNLALEVGVNRKILTEKEPRVLEIAFSSERKMMSILRKNDSKKILYCKGSFSSIIEKSASEFRSSGLKKLTQARIKELTKTVNEFEKKGLRVIAFAYKDTDSEKNLESGLVFVGLMALMDPPRKEVQRAVELCKEAGIKIKMLTGDSLLTAKTIGEQIGIIGKVVGGKELDSMSDKELMDKIDEISIFARIEPKQKLRIVEILQKKGEQVAITGDGINDILALKKADIGIAMGKRGSDISRDVSDMILLDNNFSSIVKGVEEGRLVYDNSKKATKFLLASNFDEMLLIAYSLIAQVPLPLLPLQILWINLVSDGPPAIALSKEKGEDLMKNPRKEASLLSGIFWFVLVAGIVSLIAQLFIFNYGLNNLPIEKTRTMVMFSTIGFELFFVFTCRTNKTLKEAGLFTNKYIWYAIFSIIILQLILIYTPLASVFKVVTLTSKEWLFVLLASAPGFVVFEIWKIAKKMKDGWGEREEKSIDNYYQD